MIGLDTLLPSTFIYLSAFKDGSNNLSNKNLVRLTLAIVESRFNKGEVQKKCGKNPSWGRRENKFKRNLVRTEHVC